MPESLQGQLGPFEAVDADGDGKAYPHEIEAFLAQQQAGLRAQIHSRVSDAKTCCSIAASIPIMISGSTAGKSSMPRERLRSWMTTATGS